MRFTLPVTSSTLPRLEELRTLAAPRLGAPRAVDLPEAGPGRWHVAAVGPVVCNPFAGPCKPVYSVQVEAVAAVAPERPGQFARDLAAVRAALGPGYDPSRRYPSSTAVR